MDMMALSEVNRLTHVMVKDPRDAFVDAQTIAAQWASLNFTAAPDLPRAIDEYERFVELLKSTGTTVTRLPRDTHTTLDSIYARDASLVGPSGVILCNMSDQPLEVVVVELKSASASNSAPVSLDPVTLDPEHHPVLIDTAQVRVIRTILEPHLKSPMHEHPHYVVVYLTELHTTMKMADGREVDNPRHPGDVAWRDALKHETENIGAKTAVEIQIELK